jgi:hypothetical protein
MPVADLLMGARVHVRAGLAREKKHHHHGKEEHIGRESGKDKETDAQQKFTRASMLIAPIVVSVASAACRPPDRRRLAAVSRLFPLLLRRFVRKGGGHGAPL